MLFFLSTLTVAVCAQGSGHEGLSSAAFPARVIDTAASGDRVELFVDLARVDALQAHARVRLHGFPWAGGLELELERVASPVQASALHIDGRWVESEGFYLSCWSGHVADEPDSDVFLAFSPEASFGWVKRADELVHLVTEPDEHGDWTRARTELVSERSLNESGRRMRGVCASDERVLPLALSVDAASSTAAGPTSAAPRPRRGRLAVETDWQYFQIFGNLAVARAYTTALLAAANIRFQTQVGAELHVNYLGFHTTAADPWQSQDQPGAICFDTLYEFQAAWSFGAAPVAADLHLILSGVDLGCGVAFLDALCSPDRSFAVMSRMDGLTSFPASPHPLNWDFVWTCHELGHNFGSVHTHEYCPPLDQCPPPAWFGACQTQTVCTSEGTLMSYCHACPGGMANFTTWFHPVAAQVMRAAVEASCFR